MELVDSIISIIEIILWSNGRNVELMTGLPQSLSRLLVPLAEKAVNCFLHKGMRLELTAHTLVVEPI